MQRQMTSIPEADSLDPDKEIKRVTKMRPVLVKLLPGELSSLLFLLYHYRHVMQGISGPLGYCT